MPDPRPRGVSPGGRVGSLNYHGGQLKHDFVQESLMQVKKRMLAHQRRDNRRRQLLYRIGVVLPDIDVSGGIPETGALSPVLREGQI